MQRGIILYFGQVSEDYIKIRIFNVWLRWYDY